MRSIRNSIPITLAVLFAFPIGGLAQTLSGGPFKITSSVQASGGGTSVGAGNKVIEGTAGQSAAGVLQTGGPISHVAGFWPMTLAQSQQQQNGQTTFQFSASTYSVQEDLGALAITVNRTGDPSGPATVDYWSNNSVANEKSDFEYAAGTLKFAPGETAKVFQLLVNEDIYSEGNEVLTVSLGNPSGAILGQQSTATITVMDDAQEPSVNSIDDVQSFVHMQYHDFLNREPDAPGLAFWTNQITSCGSDQGCIDAMRVNVSAAFFLSIEFQNTGYLVYRAHKAAYGNLSGSPVPIGLHQFLSETRQIGEGVVVNQSGWQQLLVSNKTGYFDGFVRTELFTTEHPGTTTPTQFVDNLFLNAKVTPSPAERQAAIDEFGGAPTSADLAARARAVRDVAENATLVQQEFNRAFVLMQYFGYLRRNPNDSPEPALNFDG
ncbi:MAG TPA: Calx-beta domain-containing protein [Pyrinomonadaceae bacterium]|nr:Calx-beta domain-containing protein [Pyrinomonadaceae bacterium]